MARRCQASGSTGYRNTGLTPGEIVNAPKVRSGCERRLPFDVGGASFPVMVEPISLTHYRDDTLWAVVASVGRTSRVAEVFSNRLAALADLAWREQQVKAYANFLRSSRQPTPSYTVRSIRRSDLPRSWCPLPALGFLQGKLF
jgi:hypothetical protein